MLTPDNHGEEAPQFAAFKPLTTVQNASNCCCNNVCLSSPILSESIFGTRYSWKVSDMDCVARVCKVENAVRQPVGVNQVQVLFVTEKLMADIDNDTRARVESAVQKVGYLPRDEQAADESQAPHLKENLPLITLIATMVISQGLEQLSHPFGQLAFVATTLVGLYPIARQASRLTESDSYFVIKTLVSVVTIGALFVGATAEAAMVLLLFSTDERPEGQVASRARQGASALMALKPETATRLRSGGRGEVTINSLRPDDAIEVTTGRHLPTDGKLLSPSASLDENALTGESISVKHTVGDRAPTGATSVDRLVTLGVLSEPGAGAIDRILKLVEEAEKRRVPIERFIDRFSRIYTPVIMAVALLVTLVPPLPFVASWQEWIYKGLTLLLIDCPCALIVSTPAVTTSELATAARRGTLTKGGATLEQLGRVTQMASDKTGTLTIGKPRVTVIHPATGTSESKLLALTTTVEQGVTHPLVQIIVREVQVARLAIPITESRRALVGSGIEAQVNGECVLICAVGKYPVSALAGLTSELESAGQTVVLVVRNDDVSGIAALRDTLRADTAIVISEPNALGAKGVILADDNPRATVIIARKLGLELKAGLLPEDEVKAVTRLNQHAPLAMADDGINDMPATKAAAIGIAMGSGTDVALETADTALTHNHLCGLARMIELARATHANIHQDIIIALGLEGIFLITMLLRITRLWLAVLADTGATVLVTTSALRLLHRR